MQVNDSLNLVVPMRRDPNGNITVYGYHTPISREVFDANYAVLAATKAALFSKGIVYAADVGPRIAALRLKDEARADAIARRDVDQDGAPNLAAVKALLVELKRLTMVLAPSSSGWDTVPVEAAMARDIIDQEDWQEAEAGLVFFTSAYAMSPRAGRAQIAEALASVLLGSATPLSLTEYAASLQTSIQAELSVAKVVSSGPS